MTVANHTMLFTGYFGGVNKSFPRSEFVCIGADIAVIVCIAAQIAFTAANLMLKNTVLPCV